MIEHEHFWRYAGGVTTSMGGDWIEKCSCGATKESQGNFAKRRVVIHEPNGAKQEFEETFPVTPYRTS